ncbi:unnamed protein product, partial [Effrenium voratum]
VETFLVKLNLGEDRMIQVARLRRAWSAVSLYFKQCDTDRSKVSATDLDSLLGDSELRDVKVAFWTRYRVRLLPELYPSDATVSRVSRELSKRLLCVFDVWKARSLQFQLTSSSKKRKLADTLFVEDADEDTVARDWEGYLEALRCWWPTPWLARAECQVPLDVLLAYDDRARRRVLQSLPHHKRLGWLQAQDLAERTEWVTKFRESTKTLGKVVMEVFEARDPHWVVRAGEGLWVKWLPAPRVRQLEETDFIAAAMDCSTKSRAREIPRKFNDGRGGASVRENPWRSLRWYLPQEQAMMEHNVQEIEEWPPLMWYPSKAEAEYTAVLAFSIAVAASWWAARVGKP